MAKQIDDITGLKERTLAQRLLANQSFWVTVAVVLVVAGIFQLFKGEMLWGIVLIIEDVSRFRLHLKYYRLAHRVFNRIKILRSAEDVQLSREAGSLYSIVTASEGEENERRIVQHAVLKADVRGSTVVTRQLIERGLNPASYFSMHFFNPINEILKKYCANKVFIEGDALILSFLEYEAEPQQYFGRIQIPAIEIDADDRVVALARLVEKDDENGSEDTGPA